MTLKRLISDNPEQVVQVDFVSDTDKSEHKLWLGSASECPLNRNIPVSNWIIDPNTGILYVML